MQIIRAFVANESGATAIEYGLIAVGISIAIVMTVRGVGTNMNNSFNKIKTNL